MYGTTVEGVPKGLDIPSGHVYGVYSFSANASGPVQGVLTNGLAPCGLDTLDRTPQHQ